MAGIMPNGGVPPQQATNALSSPDIIAPGCASLWYAPRCNPKFDPAAANAMISEIINVVACADLDYDCTKLDNLCVAIRALIAGAASPLCSLPIIAAPTVNDYIAGCFGGVAGRITIAQLLALGEGGGAGPGGQFTTWNPLDASSGLALSNENLTAINSAGGTMRGVRSVQGKVSGKYYIEFSPDGTTAPSSATFMGIKSAAESLTNNFKQTQVRGDGQIVSNGSVPPFSVPAFTLASVGSIAIDVDNERIWFRNNGSDWNGNASADPSANVGGIDYDFDGQAAFLAMRSSPAGTGYTINTGVSTFVHPVPAGFTVGWPI